MKINELRILIQEIIAEETSLDEIFITLPGLDNEKATQSYRDTENAYKAGYGEGYNYAINIHNTSTNEGRISNFLFGSDATDEELEAWLMKNKQIQTALNKMDPNKAKLWKEYVKSNKADKIKNSEAIMNVFWDGEKWSGSKPTSGNWTESKN
jgi:hypothetical protein